MKRLFSFLAILAIISVSNCSEIPENNDPVLGIWSNTEAISESDETPVAEEWIFNDVYLGRYHRYSKNEIVVQTDFRWEVEDGVYTITYHLEEMLQVNVLLKQSTASDQLELQNGEVFAVRQ